MRNSVVLACVAAFIFSCSYIIAQPSRSDTSIAVTTLEGATATLHIISDYLTDKLTIELSPATEDSFMVTGKIINITKIDKFVYLMYGFQDAYNAMLLCVSKGHLYEPLNFDSYDQYNQADSADPRFEMNSLTRENLLGIQNNGNGCYHLTETDYEKVIYPHDTAESYTTCDTLIYKFDPVERSFNYVAKNGVDMGEDTGFVIKSLEDKPVKIFMKFDYQNHKLAMLLSPSEMICLDDYSNMEEIKIYDKFISLTYDVVEGSDVGEEQTVFICVSKEHLLRPLEVVSVNQYDFSETYDAEADSMGLYDEHGHFDVKFKNLSNADATSKNHSASKLELTAVQFEKVKNKHDSAKNHKTCDTLHLLFDENDKVFYNNFLTLNGDYALESDTTHITQRFNNIKIPSIAFKAHGSFFSQYVFLDGYWYYFTETELANHILNGPVHVCR